MIFKKVRSPRRFAPRDDTQPRIVVGGSSKTDMIVRAANIPRPGETVIGGEFRMAAGPDEKRDRGVRIEKAYGGYESPIGTP